MFTVIVMPTFGFTSLAALLLSGATGIVPWECIFPTHSGGFFTNYVITASLVGCGIHLIRLKELLLYAIRVCFSRSKAELPFIQSNRTKFEFRFGEHYARTMIILFMVVTYSIVCPLITPFGLIYFLIKHSVDRYNLTHGYKPTKMSKKSYKTLINYITLSTLTLQLFLLIVISIRTELFDDLKFDEFEDLTFNLIFIVSCLLFFLSVNIYFSSFWSKMCNKSNPVEYVERMPVEETDETKLSQLYVPMVLKFDDNEQSVQKTEK